MSLTLEQARARAALIDVANYDIHIDFTDGATFGSRTTATFTCREPGASTFIELHEATNLRARLNGQELPSSAYTGGHLHLPNLAASNVVEIEADVAYVNDGDGMHRFTDPADGQTYASAYLGMDVAHKIFACFDQPDLKATMSVSATAPQEWTVIGNGISQREANTWTFATTPRISTYLFVICAGPWSSHHFEHAGLPFAWHARASQAQALARDAEFLETHTRGCFDAYTGYFDAPYPFDSYEQLFVPGHNWGALETPGAVTFNDKYLTPDAPTQPERMRTAMVIAHEMAHMWFGNLVTMRWWEDSWLNESFADYMGIRIAREVSGLDLASYDALDVMAAYSADVRRSTHPVAPNPEDVPQAETALGNFDALTYRKGRAALKQLVTWLGDEAFFAGVNRHLNTHAFSNASLADFTESLAQAAPERDVQGWVQAWLRTTGFDTISLEYDGDVPVLTRTGSRPHRFSVTEGHLVDLNDQPLRLPELAGQPVIPNSGDETYAKVTYDEDTWAIRSREFAPHPRTRAVLMRAAIDRVRDVQMSPTEFLSSWLPHQLRQEDDPEIISTALELEIPKVMRWVHPADVAEVEDDVEELAVQILQTQPSRDVALPALLAVARTDTDVESLQRLLDAGHMHEVELTKQVRWAIVRRLAELGDVSALEREAAADRSWEGTLGALEARAAIATPEAKSQAWARMFDPSVSGEEFEASSNGFWAVGQHALIEEWATKYVDATIDLSRTAGQGLINKVSWHVPRAPMSMDTMVTLRTQLAQACSGELPYTMPRRWNDAIDDLDLTIAIRGVWGDLPQA